MPDGICETKACGYISQPLTQAQWQSIVDFFATSPNPWSLACPGPMGRDQPYPVDGSAFIHRNVDADLVVDVFWRNPQERIEMEAWLDRFMQLVRPFLNGHVYQNYPDSRLRFQPRLLGRSLPCLAAGQGDVRPRKLLLPAGIALPGNPADTVQAGTPA